MPNSKSTLGGALPRVDFQTLPNFQFTISHTKILKIGGSRKYQTDKIRLPISDFSQLTFHAIGMVNIECRHRRKKANRGRLKPSYDLR